MTPLQQVEYELLKIFVEICEKHDLEYYLVCGSALGAVKYGGFIPWDDDIDVGMPREEYEVFLRLAKDELPEWCFLQNYMTDPYFPHAFTKLRNSNTTYIEKNVAHLPIHHGVYIDIFPLDGYPEGKFAAAWFDLRKKLFTWKQYCALRGDPNPKVQFRNRVFKAMGYHKRTAKTLFRLNRFYSKIPAETSKVWCNHCNWQRKLEYAPRWQYGNGARATFEGMCVRVPENADAYLTQKYGDWRADLPEAQKVGHHFYTVCDLEKPYVFYMGHE